MTVCVSSLILQSLLGVSYSLLACALWPMVAFVVPEHQLGTAYGLYVPVTLFTLNTHTIMSVIVLLFITDT